MSSRTDGGRDSSYKRPPGEYIRPSGRLVLLGESLHGDSRGDSVAGDWAYQENVSRLPWADVFELEMVPEPGNPWDSKAISLEFNGARVGYIPGNDADLWHDCIRAMNRRGTAVYVRAKAKRNPEWKNVYIRMALPSWATLERIADEHGLIRECDALLGVLPAQMYEAAVDKGWLSEHCAPLLRQHRNLAPSLSWRPPQDRSGGDVWPGLLDLRIWSTRIRRWEAAKRERAAERARKAEERRARAEEKKQADHEKAQERMQLQAEALKLHKTGASQPDIAKALGCTPGVVTGLLRSAGVPPDTDYNSNQRQQRVKEAASMLSMQRAGKSRREIAVATGRGLDGVKQLLKDAKFYEDPSKDPQRQRLIALCRAAAEAGKSIKEIAEELGITEVRVKEAGRDYRILHNDGPGGMPRSAQPKGAR